MTAYLDFTLFSLLNLQAMEWPDGLQTVKTSNVLAYTACGLCLSIPFLLLIHSIRKRQQWQNENFKGKYGEFLSGAAKN